VGCEAAEVRESPTFLRNIPPPSSATAINPSKKPAEAGGKQKMQVRCSSEMSGFFSTTQCSNPYDHTLVCSMTSYIVGSHFASMVGSVRILDMLAVHPSQNAGSTLALTCCGGP
jgi:hypothetical protein